MDQVPWTNTVCNGHFSPFYLLKLADTEWQKTSEDAKTGHVNVAKHFRSISEAFEKQLRSSGNSMKSQASNFNRNSEQTCNLSLQQDPMD